MLCRFARGLAAGTMFALSVSAADAVEIPLTFTTTSSSATIIPNGATVTTTPRFVSAVAAILLPAGSYSFVWQETLSRYTEGAFALIITGTPFGGPLIFNMSDAKRNNVSSASAYIYRDTFSLAAPSTLLFILNQRVQPTGWGPASITGFVSLIGTPPPPPPTPVPGPIAGAGVPVAAGLLGFAVWRRRKSAAARG